MGLQETFADKNLPPHRARNRYRSSPLPVDTAYLNQPDDVAKAKEVLLQGQPLIMEGGSMYGTIFLPQFREEVARRREETFPLETVSILTSHATVINWLDIHHINPTIAQAIRNGSLKSLTDIMFIRFPADTSKLSPELTKHSVNSQQEIQTFIMSDSHPLLNIMKLAGHDGLLVRSSNKHNHPEATTYAEAKNYAHSIGSPLIVLRHPLVPTEESRRKRVGTNTILRITGNPVIEVRRVGNTGPETTRRLLIASGLLSPGISLSVDLDKNRAHLPAYESPEDLNSVEAIRTDLLIAAGYLGISQAS